MAEAENRDNQSLQIYSSSVMRLDSKEGIKRFRVHYQYILLYVPMHYIIFDGR